MKKIVLVSMLTVVGGLGFTVSASAQDTTCADLVWSAEVLANTPNIAQHCLEVMEKNGQQVAKLHARVVRQSVNSTIVQWQLPDGSWSASERRYPEKGFTAQVGDKDVKITDLPVRQEVNVYVPMAGNWSTASAAPAPAAPAAAPVAAPAPAPAPMAEPEPMPEPEPEPEPAMLPTTATQVPLFALLGGALLLLGGAVSFLRSRM
jgi:hypothetical protein